MSNKGNPTISIGIEMPDLDSFITKTENKISDLENLSVDFGLADSFKKELNEMKGMMGDLKQTLSSVNNQKLSSATYNKFSKDITKKVEELNERTTVLEKNLSAVVNTISQNASSKLSESIQELQGDMGNLAKTCKNAVEGIAEVRKAAGSNVKINLFNAQKAAAEELLDDLSEIKKAFDSGDNNLEYAYEIKDKDLKRATKEIDELIERHSELEKRTKSISINTSDYDKLQRELAETTIEIIRYADGLQKLGTTDAKKILNRVFNFEFSGEKIKKSLSQVYDSVLGQVDKLYKTLEQQVENAKDAMRELGDIEERKDKSSNIKGYRIPVDVSTKENLEKKLKNLIDAVRPFAEKQHLDIGISLVTEWGTRKNKKMLQEFQDQINKSADEIDVKALQDLHDQIEKSFNDQIVLKIGSNVEVEKKHILKVIGELQSEIKANPLNIDINLSKEKKDELRSTLDKIVDGVTINIKKVKFDKDLSSTQKDRLGLSEKEIDGLFDKLIELQNKLMGLPDSLKDVTRILQTAFNFTSFETLDSIFSDIQKKVQGISGRLQGKNLNDIKEVLEQFKEYQRLGGTKALTDIGGAQNVKKWLSKRQAELEESNKGRNRSEKLGNDFGEGYALGVREAITAVEKAAIEMTEAAINAVASTQDSHSPSKVAEQLGLYWGEGYATGILKGKGAIKNAIRALVDEGKLVLKDLTEDTIETQYSDAVYQDIVNKKVSTKNAQKYQQIIKNNDKEVNAYQKLATEKGLIELFRSLDKSSEQARQIWNIHNESIKKLKSGTLDAEKAVERLTDAFDKLNKKKVSPIDNEWIDVNDSDDYRNSIQKRNIASSGKVKEEIKELGDELEETGDKGKRASEKISNGMQKVSKETSKSKRSVKKNKDVETFNQLIEQSLKGSKAYEAIGENADKLIEEYAEHIRSGEKTVQKAFEEVFNIASKAYDAKLAEPELNKFKQLATEKGLTKIPGILPIDSKGIILDKQAELLEGIKSGALTAAEAVEELAKSFDEVNNKEKAAVEDSKNIDKKKEKIAELRKQLEDYGNELVKIEKKSKGDSKKYNELQKKYLSKNQINPSTINAEIQQLEHEVRLLEEEADAQAKATEEKKKAAEAQAKWLEEMKKKYPDETPVSTDTKPLEETSKFAGKTREELEECLKAENSILKRCKEGSDAYNKRQANIEEINSLLKQSEVLTGVSEDELKSQEQIFGDIDSNASQTMKTLKTEESVINEISEGMREAANSTEEMAEAAKKFDVNISNKTYRSLFDYSQTRKNRAGDITYPVTKEQKQKQSEANHILEQIKKYQQSGDIEILNEIQKYSENSSFTSKIKKSISNSIEKTIKGLEKAVVDTVEEVIKEVPVPKKTITMTKGQYKDYYGKKTGLGKGDNFESNFDLHWNKLLKNGTAFKQGRGYKVKVEVEDTGTEKAKENIDKVTKSAKNLDKVAKDIGKNEWIDVSVEDLKHQEELFGDIGNSANQTNKILEEESDVIKEMSSDSKTLDDRFDSLRKAVESFNSFNLSKTKDKEALQTFVDKYSIYRNLGGTRDITELTSDTKAQEKLLKAYNLRINAQKDLNNAKKETINQSQKDIANQQEFIDVIDKGTDKLNEQKKAQKELNSTKSKGSTQQKSNEDFIDVNSKVVKSADQTNKSVKKAADAIKEEGKAAKISAKQKEEFAKANKKVAESADKTASSTEKAAEGVSKEGKASKGYDLKAAKEQAKKVYKEIDKQLNQFESDGYITRVDKAYDSHNLLAQALITAEKRIEDESGKLIKETQKLNVKYNKNQRVAYTSQMTSDDYKFNDKLAIQDGKVGANVQAAYNQFLKLKNEIQEDIGLTKEFGKQVEQLDKSFHETGNETGALQYVKQQYSDLKDSVKRFKAEQDKAARADKDALKAAKKAAEAQNKSYQKKQQESAKKSEEKQKEDIKEINKLLDEQADAYKKIITTQKEIDLLDKSKNNEKTELEKIKKENQKKYLKSKKSLGTYDQDLVNQLKSKDRLSSIRNEVESKYALKNAKLIDSENLDKANSAYSRIINNLKVINKLQEEVISGVSNKDNSSNIESAQREIAELRAKNNEAAREIVALDAKDAEKNQEVLKQIREINHTREQSTNSAKSSDVSKINTWAKNLEELANSGKYTEKFTEELREAAQEFREVAKAADSVDLDELNKQTEELGKRFEDLNGAKSLKDMQVAAQSSLEKLRNKIAKITEENTAMGRKFKQQFDNLEIRLHGADLSKAEVEKITAEIFRLDTQLERTNNTGKSFFDMFTTRLKGMNATFFARYFSFYDIIRYARQAFDILRDLDTQLVDLRKTTSMNNTELENFYKNSTNVGKALGVSSSEIISQASAWSRLGYSTGEAATKMAELSSQFTSISPGMDTEKATDGLVSAMKGFGIAVDDVERSIMDNINKIGKIFAEMYGNIQNYLLVR